MGAAPQTIIFRKLFLRSTFASLIVRLYLQLNFKVDDAGKIRKKCNIFGLVGAPQGTTHALHF